MPRRRRIVVAATGSVGPTIATRAIATAQGRSKAKWATVPTTTAVASTSPIESSEITRVSWRRALRSTKKAPE
jgi:hypothetical protein